MALRAKSVALDSRAQRSIRQLIIQTAIEQGKYDIAYEHLVRGETNLDIRRLIIQTMIEQQAWSVLSAHIMHVGDDEESRALIVNAMKIAPLSVIISCQRYFKDAEIKEIASVRTDFTLPEEDIFSV